MPYVKPVLYVMKDEWNPLQHVARSHGWYVYLVPKSNDEMLPVLRSLFMHAQNHSQTTFYGYANANILFDEDLIKTLHAVMDNLEQFRRLLLIGIRTNIDIPPGIHVESLRAVRYWKEKGTAHYPFPADYFITTHSGFPWEMIPDFVIGRSGRTFIILLII